MLRLVIDTSTKWIYVGLISDDEVLAYNQFVSEKTHSALFIPTIQTILRSNNLEVSDLDEIYCGIGPGSYTGQRIAITVAKMFSSFKNIKLYKVSSLYLASSGYDNKNVACLFDARRGNAFSACYGEVEIEDKLRNQEEFLESIKDLEDLKVVYEDDFKVNPMKVIARGELVQNVDLLVPNYLRISEAEYNLKHNG